MDLFLIEMGTYKVFFDLETSQDKATEIINRYDKAAEVHNFYSKREIGCNTWTFAVVTSSLEKIRDMERDALITRVEIISTFRGAAPTKCCDSHKPC